ncbi:MAG: Rossmann-like and DUF2520 domain-containing protein [Synergistota bacterium]|nr:Rossmann-like and DUF2520 domain-containing protein [Synergistota bacterium]
MESRSRQRIGFIGAGKAGVSLGSYFASKRLVISGYSSRTMESALSAARITASEAFPSLKQLTDHSDIIVISTPDDALPAVWKELRTLDLEGRILAHLSGSLSSDIFEGIGQKGASGYSVHPMFAFSGSDGSFEGLQDASFTLEGTEERIGEVMELFKITGNKTLVIKKEHKTLYHASNVMVSNLVIALVSAGCRSFERCGVLGGDPLSALFPLIRCNIDNISGRGLPGALTGPAERNDINTVRKHLDVLDEEERTIYILLTEKLVELAGEKHPERDYTELLTLLKDNR